MGNFWMKSLLDSLKKASTNFFNAMVYLFYIDPPVLAGEPSEVLSFVRSIQHNVLVPIFEDGRLDFEINEKVKSISDINYRKRIEETLKRMKKHKRFLYYIESDDDSKKSELECALEQEKECNISVFITNTRLENEKVYSLSEYMLSNFADTNEQLVSNGLFFHGGEEKPAPFLEKYFLNILRHARSIDICDKLIGEKNCSRNFKDSLEVILQFINRVNFEPQNCEVTLHTGIPIGQGASHIQNILSNVAENLKVTLRLYGQSGQRVDFHHDRFLKTEHFAIMITCGFDVLDIANNCNRKTNLDFKNGKDITASLTQTARSGIRNILCY